MVAFGREHPVLAALLLAIPIVGVVFLVGSRLEDEAGHAASHLAVAVPPLLLLFSSRRWRSNDAEGPGSVARKVLVTGLAVLGFGQVFEAIGGLGFEGYERQYEWLATLHDVSMLSMPAGVLLLLIGGTLMATWRMKQSSAGSGRIALVMLVAVALGGLVLKSVLFGS